ncbi:hypothetical protein, partial [Vibrio anguillarum]|uniref:hypothetical protein n=1 Tax=Vibrio anguillarum TaxID=55601 RepID=UPI001BE4A90D
EIAFSLDTTSDSVYSFMVIVNSVSVGCDKKPVVVQAVTGFNLFCNQWFRLCDFSKCIATMWAFNMS